MSRKEISYDINRNNKIKMFKDVDLNFVELYADRFDSDGYYNALAENMTGNGTKDDSEALQTLLTTIDNNDATIYFPRGTYKLSSDITTPSNVNLKMEIGGIFSPDSGKTLTINGGIDAGLWQIFSGDGDVLGSPRILKCYPEWFGAVADGFLNDGSSPSDAGTMTDNTAPFNKAFAFYKHLKLSNGKYRVLNVFAPIDSTVKGIGKNKSYLGIYIPGSIDYNFVMSFNEENITISDLTFDMYDMQGNIQGDLNAGLLCGFIREDAKNIRLKNVRFQNNGYGCIYLGDCSYVYFDDCEFINVDTGINGGSTAGTESSFIYVNECIFDGSIKSEPIGLTRGTNVFITNCDARNKQDGNGFNFAGGTNILVDNCVFENLGACVFVQWDSSTSRYSTGITITNNEFINAIFREVVVQDNSQDVLIDNNTFVKEDIPQSLSSICVFIDSSSNATVTRNKFFSAKDNNIYVHGVAYTVGNILISKNHFYPQVADKKIIWITGTNLTSEVVIEKNYFHDFGGDIKQLVEVDTTIGVEKIVFKDDNWIEGAQVISNIPISVSTTLRSPLYFTAYAVGDVYRPIASTTIFVKVCTVAGYLDKGTTWGATTAYTTEDTLLIGSNLYYPIADGTSGGTPPTESGTSDIIDNEITWTHLGTPGTFGGEVAIT